MNNERSPRDKERLQQGRRLEELVRDRWTDSSGVSGLAQQLGVSRATLYAWFKGSGSPDTAALTRLARLLRMSPSMLLALVEESSTPASPTPEMLSLFSTPDSARDQGRRAPTPAAWRTPSTPTDWPSGVQEASVPLIKMVMATSRPEGPSLLGVLGRQRVMSCDADDPIGPLAQRMLKLNYSQVPVRDRGSWVAVLTNDAIARWSAARPGRLLGHDEDAPVREVLAHTEEADNFRIVRADAPIGIVLSIFEEFAFLGRMPDAILVTRSGGPHDDLLGIITGSDLSKLRAGMRR